MRDIKHTEKHKKNLLVMSFHRHYAFTPGTNGGSVEERKKPLGFMGMAKEINERCHKMGPRTVACVMLGIDLSERVDDYVTGATDIIAQKFLPPDLMRLLPAPDKLAARLEEKYPAAHNEFKNWSKADPVKYFGAELEPQGVAAIPNPYRKHIVEAISGRAKLAAAASVPFPSADAGFVAKLSKPDKPMILE